MATLLHAPAPNTPTYDIRISELQRVILECALREFTLRHLGTTHYPEGIDEMAANMLILVTNRTLSYKLQTTGINSFIL